MAKRCPVLNKPVIYLDCMDCEHKKECREGKFDNKEKEIKITHQCEHRRVGKP